MGGSQSRKHRQEGRMNERDAEEGVRLPAGELLFTLWPAEEFS